jgi:hypothetical protein
MRYLKVGEYTTALNDAPYAITSNGWTGLVKEFYKESSIKVCGTDYRRRQEHAHTFPVLERFFIPYSPNLETAGFLNFIKWKGDE